LKERAGQEDCLEGGTFTSRNPHLKDMTANIEELQRLNHLYRGVVEVSALINSITDFDELLSAILDVASRVMRAEASSLFLIDPDTGDLELTIARGPAGDCLSRPAKIKVPRGRGIVGWVQEQRQSLLVIDAYNDSRFYPELDRCSGFVTRSVLCVPLFQSEVEIGVLEVLNPLDKPHFDSIDLEAFEAYGSMVATAIAKMRAIERDRQRRLLEKDLELATEIQHSFLPDMLPSTQLLDFAVRYHPAREIAGDFYDVFERNEGEFYFVVGDVSGKGISAALMMAQALSMLRFIVHPEMSPADVLRRWNARLWDRTIHGMFITAVLGRVVLPSSLIEFSLAGHFAPMLRRGIGQVEEPPIEASPPLGVVRDLSFALNQIKLLPGTQAIFYTDGLIESFNTSREPFSMDRLRKVLAQPLSGSEQVVEALIQAEAEHRGDISPHDDLTILTIGRK
jgi:Serine phosphatase RsbU, regulator of sigma subunit